MEVHNFNTSMVSINQISAMHLIILLRNMFDLQSSRLIEATSSSMDPVSSAGIGYQWSSVSLVPEKIHIHIVNLMSFSSRSYKRFFFLFYLLLLVFGIIEIEPINQTGLSSCPVLQGWCPRMTTRTSY